MNIVPIVPYVSPEVAKAAASERTEAETRAQIAEAGQRAFLTVVQTASELTATGLPPGKTVAEALARARARRDYLWGQDIDEDDRIDALVSFCTALYGGNVPSGQSLASAVIWS